MGTEVSARSALARVGIHLPISAAAQLYQYVLATTGIAIPRRRICPHHSSPWDAFCFSYFAGLPGTDIRGTNSLWQASRGFGGKSFQLALLVNTEALTMRASSTVMGGSERQSQNVVSYLGEWADDPSAPPDSVESASLTKFRYRNGAEIRALPASQKAARGPHVPRFRGDEIDEMEEPILEAALGQSMSRHGIPQQNTFSSTHHNAAGTMSAYKKRARDRGWPVFEWCYEETRVSNGGWLPDADIEAKRETVSEYMWAIEYDHQAPNPGSLAIRPEVVDRAFDPHFGIYDGADGEQIRLPGFPLSTPCNHGTGADWAKEQDWTVITTFADLPDQIFALCVAFCRLHRMDWNYMVGLFDARLRLFPGSGHHDATGIGNVVADLLQVAAEGVTLVGRARADLFTEYIAALEKGHVRYPRIRWAYEEHKEATVAHLYGSKHPPDSIVAGALGWRALQIARQGIREGTLTVAADSAPGGLDGLL